MRPIHQTTNNHRSIQTASHPLATGICQTTPHYEASSQWVSQLVRPPLHSPALPFLLLPNLPPRLDALSEFSIFSLDRGPQAAATPNEDPKEGWLGLLLLHCGGVGDEMLVSILLFLLFTRGHLLLYFVLSRIQGLRHSRTLLRKIPLGHTNTFYCTTDSTSCSTTFHAHLIHTLKRDCQSVPEVSRGLAGKLLQGAVLGKQGLRFNLSARQLFTGDDEYTIEVQLWCWRGWSFRHSVVVVVVVAVESSLRSSGQPYFHWCVERGGDWIGSRRGSEEREREREIEWVSERGKYPVVMRVLEVSWIESLIKIIEWIPKLKRKEWRRESDKGNEASWAFEPDPPWPINSFFVGHSHFPFIPQ